MSEDMGARAREMAETIYRAESRRVFATLVRLLGDFDLAEEGLHDAFRAALEQWPRDGVPANPRAWLVSAGRFKAIDGIRRQARFVAIDDVAEQVEAIADDAPGWDDESIEDDRLRLVFTCCHPALSPNNTPSVSPFIQNSWTEAGRRAVGTNHPRMRREPRSGCRINQQSPSDIRVCEPFGRICNRFVSALDLHFLVCVTSRDDHVQGPKTGG